MAKELGAIGITVHAIAPGLTTSHCLKVARRKKMYLKPSYSTKTFIVTEDIAGSVLFLASNWTSIVTGQCINVDDELVMN
jgi:3-oxoacyl-[acyl-carrier protein] reductase